MDLSKITTKIPKEIYEWGEQNAGTYFSFVSVLSYRYGEVVERAFCIRKYAKKGILITEVRRRATGENQTIVKNLLYTRMGVIFLYSRELTNFIIAMVGICLCLIKRISTNGMKLLCP